MLASSMSNPKLGDGEVSWFSHSTCDGKPRDRHTDLCLIWLQFSGSFFLCKSPFKWKV